MLKFSFMIRKVDRMTQDLFVDHHRNHHAPLFMSIPETKQYVKKYVVSHPVEVPGFPKPLYDGVTDIYFESMDDFNAFYASDNYKTKVHPDESNFIKLDEVVTLVTDEKVVVG
ncbi:MAG: EthD domain-containing protein [Sphingobacterium sp.]